MGEKKLDVAAVAPGWKKWLPSNLTSPHWYDRERFARLVSAYIAHDADRGEDRTVRAFVAEFDGLCSTAKQTNVLSQTGLKRTNLSDLVVNGDIDGAAAEKLLTAMQQQSKPVTPQRLGWIGKDALRSRFEALGCQPECFQYKPSRGTTDGIPWLQETAFGYAPQAKSRRLIAGVNWSPGILNPFRQLGRFGRSLDSVLSDLYAGNDEPIVIFLHLACPRVEYTDRGKSAVVIH